MIKFSLRGALIFPSWVIVVIHFLTQGGMVAAGLSKSEPFTHQLEIQLRGSIDPNDPDNEEFPMPEGVPNVGWKAIGVFGALKLHGTVSGQSWHKLGATAEAGSTTITLAEAPDASWLNKMVSEALQK